MGLSAKQTGPADLRIFDDAEQVAEISGLKLTYARFRPGGRPLIGPTFPLFLFWMQYANHEHPERNAGSGALVEIVSQQTDRVVIRCLGRTASGTCSSTAVLTIRRTPDPIRYLYSVQAAFDVVSEKGWLVTPNATQGEVEFANLWPEGTFSPNRDEPKRYQACYLVTASGVERIPHHHLETSDKHNIPLNRGDRFMWLREDENLSLTLLSDRTAEAGVCAYMWDAHFAYKVCDAGKDVLLPAGTRVEAAYEVSDLDSSEADAIIRRAVNRPTLDPGTIPLYVPGLNRFTETGADVGSDCRYIWPWEAEGHSTSRLVLDRDIGFDDRSSLRIVNETKTRSCWKATTLGPAFGGETFTGGSRHQLTAMVRTSALEGKAMIAIRLHREGKGSPVDIQNYETFTSEQALQGDTEWTLLRVVTPPVTPAPDRIHLLLIQEGRGSTWFDNVQFEVIA